MGTCFAISSGGVRIAYDVNGAGAPVVLLHGGSQSRQNWHSAGYIERLKPDFKVIAIDIRGNGESDKPTQPAELTVMKTSSGVALDMEGGNQNGGHCRK